MRDGSYATQITEKATEAQIREGQTMLEKAASAEDPVPALKELGITGMAIITVAGATRELIEASTNVILENRPQTHNPKKIANLIAQYINRKL